MLSFNSLLVAENIDPAVVRLVRHQDERSQTTPYELWRKKDGSFERYQRIQARQCFAGSKFIASFVATPIGETLFAGVFKIVGVAKSPRGLIDPISGLPTSAAVYYDLRMSDELGNYRGRIVIDWGRGYRSWIQHAKKQPKRIVEILRNEVDPPFPGFLSFSSQLSRLRAVPLSWRAALSAVWGVYLLTCPRSGKHYVGSASAEEGFWSRWNNYVSSGHGGNVRMKRLPCSDYLVTILEVSSSTVTREDLIRLEERWKAKLRSREFGLNGN